MRLHLALGTLTLTFVWIAACSSSNDAAGGGMPTGDPAVSSGTGGYGGGGAYGGAGAVGNSGSGGSAGGYAAGGAAGAPPRPGADAGPDAADAGLTCDGLDDSKDAVFYLSSDDSNSMASPVIARSLIENGQTVPASLIRTYEFLNYYNVGYPSAPAGTLSIVPELAQGSAPGAFELQVGVVSPAAVKPRRPVNITFVLDTSGSMGGSPIQLERETVKAIAGQLQAGDKVSAVTWNTSNAVVLDSYGVGGPNDPAVMDMANQISAVGGTDLNGGLSAGYALAQKNFVAGQLNRVVLISDGQANAGVTDKEIIAKGAALNDGDGVYLVGVGVGTGVNDTLMNAVTDAGRGAYVYLDESAEVSRMFGQRFDEVMDVAARAVQVQLRMPWYMNIEVFHGEEYSTDPKEVEPQHLAPNDAMVFNQVVRACSPDVVADADPIELVVSWETPDTHQSKQVQKTTTFADLLGATPLYLAKGSAIVAYAEALKQPSKSRLQAALDAVKSANAGGTDPELTEIQALLEKALLQY